jgi:hypothetical protein
MLHQFAGGRIAGARLADPLLEAAAADLVEPHAEALQRMANDVLELEELPLQVAAMGQKKGFNRQAPSVLTLRPPEPASAHHSPDPAHP